MERVIFRPNVPQQIALKYPQARLISGRWGEQMLYTLTDDRQMYVPTDVAAKINTLGVNVNEPFCICKRWNGERGQPVRWDVWLTPQAEQARAVQETEAETPLEKQLRESLENIRRPATLVIPKVPAGKSEGTQTEPNSVPKERGNPDGKLNGAPLGDGQQAQLAMARFSWAPVLLSQAQALTDVYAAALEYASKGHGNHIKPEDVRALMTTAFINLSQRGGVRST